MTRGDADKICDVVLEGGGVKGIGLAGALHVLETAGYEFRRVAGTSAGAIAGSLLAAGMPQSAMHALLSQVDYKKFRDPTALDRFGWPGEGLSLLLTKGLYEGRYLHDWLRDQLAILGVHTFGDLRLNPATTPWAASLPPERRYKLVIIASDVSRGRLVHLPWDYHIYGLDPDKQPVADAVRASMSIPFFYQPAKLGDKFLVDGGILSNFPIDIFDDTAQWPTLGIKLSAHERAEVTSNPVHNPVDFTTAILDTMMEAHDRMHLDEPSTAARTMFVDTLNTKATDFNIKPRTQQALYMQGQKAATKFLKTWDYTEYKHQFSID